MSKERGGPGVAAGSRRAPAVTAIRMKFDPAYNIDGVVGPAVPGLPRLLGN